MQTSTPGAQTPDAVELQVSVPESPKTVGAIPGLKIKIMTALAALGIVAASVENAEGAITITGTSFGSTVTNPSNRNVTGIGASEADGYNADGISSLYSNKGTNGQLVMSTSTFATINVTSADAGLYGGNLTITGWARTGIGGSFTGSSGYSNTNFSVLHELRGIPSSGPTVTLWQNNLLGGTNDGLSSITSTEASAVGIPENSSFSFDIAVPVGGLANFNLQNYVEALNTESHGRFTGNTITNTSTLNFAFTPNTIPEPSTTGLVGATLAALALRRKRENKQD